MPSNDNMPPNSEKKPPTGKPPEQPPQSKGPIPGGWIILILLGAGFIFWLLYQYSSDGIKIPYSVFKKQVEKNAVKNVKIYPDKITGELATLRKLEDEKLKEHFSREPYHFYVTLIENQQETANIISLLDQYNIQHQFAQKSGTWLNLMLLYLLPTLLILALFFFFLLPRMRDSMGGGFLNSYVKSPAKRYEKTKGRISFEDVADMENAKQELQEVVDFLKSPEKFQKLGAQIPKGVLLIGPPGTGKTLLARAVAGEAGVPFYSINGSEFIQMFVGVGASRVRDLFKNSRDNAPCIMFIDEIDAVGRARGTGVGGGHDEREQTLNQILSEMDGFLPSETVIVVAATNRPDVLDPALLRPGRFDRHVTIDRPTWKGRLEILKVHTRDKPLANDVDLETIARTLIGMTGADLRNLANEAALLATRQGKNRIDQKDFNDAADRVIMGAKREEILNDEDKKKTAYHEAGHAITSWYEKECDKPLKVTIIPRGQALGVNINVPDEDRLHSSKSIYEARLVMIMGGRAADKLIFGQPYSGEEMDLKQATRIARLMVTQWGMSEQLGPVAYRTGSEHVFLGKEMHEPPDFSEGTAQLIDEEVRKILRHAEERALHLLQTHRDKLDLLVEYLLQQEELSRDEIDQLLENGRLDIPQETSDVDKIHDMEPKQNGDELNTSSIPTDAASEATSTTGK